jgi:phage terminase large subunit-like protein
VFFDKAKADHAVAFIENYLRHTEGEVAGQPFKLAPFQREFIEKVFGTVKDSDGETRQYKTVFFTIARKNSKTALCAAIALYMLLCDGEHGAQCVSAAYNREQASKLYIMAENMVLANPKLRKRTDLIPSQKKIKAPKKGGTYQAISADSSSAQGGNFSCVLYDECAEAKNTKLMGALTSGSNLRRQPLFIFLGTAGVNNKSPVYEHHLEYSENLKKGLFVDDTYLPVIYTIPQDLDWRDETYWPLSNPALLPGGFMSYAPLREDAAKAKRFPNLEADFRRYYANQMVSSVERWIPLAEFDACRSATQFDETSLKALPCYIGVDLSSTTDLTAVCNVWVAPDSIYIRTAFFYPTEDLQQKSEQSRIPFDKWSDAGLLITTPGRTINLEVVKQHIREQCAKYTVKEVCYDPALAVRFADELASENYPMVKILQYPKFLSMAAKDLEKRVLDRTIKHEGHPIMRFCVDSASIQQTSYGLVKLVKPNANKKSARIDGVAALLTAMARACVSELMLVKPSVYESRELIVL